MGGRGSRAARALLLAFATRPHRTAALPDNRRAPAFPDDPSIVLVEPPPTDAAAEGPASIGVDRRPTAAAHDDDGSIGSFVDRRAADDDSSFVSLKRALQTNNSKCQPNESLWIFTLFTDRYPWETSWRLFDPNGAKIASGPPEGTNYERETRYVGAMCLRPGRYVLRMLDLQGDGICCDFGEGSFNVAVNGKAVVQSDDTNYKVKGYRFNVPQRDVPNPPVPPPPTPRPTQRPNGQQQADDAEPEVAVSFIMIGDTPYRTDHRYCLNQQLRTLDPSQMAQPYKFIIHVGDIMSGQVSCDSERYSDVAEMFAHESNAIHYDTRDVFFVIGDNEWSDCDDMDKAMSNWMNNFGNGQKTNGRNTGPNPNGYGTSSNGQIWRTLIYDNQGENSIWGTYPSSASNFAFFHNKVLFLGINQVGGSSLGDELRRLGNNFRWVKQNMAKYKNRLKSVVVFAHADMDSARWNYFGKPFQKLLRVEYPDIFCLFAHGDWHEFWISRPDEDNANLVDLSCDSGEKAEPLLVSITRDPNGGRDGLVVDRRGGRFGGGGCDEGSREKTWSSKIS